MYQRIFLRILLIVASASLALSSQLVCKSTTNGRACACEGQKFSISCTNNARIQILGAIYGRLENETCNDGKHTNYSLWKLNCSSPNAMTVLEKECNNKTNCPLNLVNAMFRVDPCPNTGKYLTVDYTCLPGTPKMVPAPLSELLMNWTKWCENLKINFSIASSVKIMGEIKETSKRDDLNGSDLYAMTNIMVELVELVYNRSNFMVADAENFNELVLYSISTLLSDAYNRIWMELDPYDKSKTATRLLVAMEDSSAVLAKVIDRKPASGIDELKIEKVSQTSSVTLDSSDSVTFDASDSHFEINLQPGGLRRAVFIQYNNIENLLKATKTIKSQTNEASDNNETHFEPIIITKVVSASIVPSSELKQPVQFTLRHKLEPINSTSLSCVFWNFKKIDFVGDWSDEGCKVVSSNKDNTTCECDHLTNFAVLMSAVNIPKEHAFALQVISQIGCIISIVFLALAFLTFCFFRNLQSERNTIHKNLVLCLLIAELVFVIGINPINELVCAFVAGLLHYFFLASFAWMCLEGVQLYVLLIEVFEKEKSRVKWYYLGGYGIPAVIVSISVAVNIYMTNVTGFANTYPYGAYGTKEHCWLSIERGFIWAFNGPVISIFAVNSAMLGMAIYMMCKHASSTASWKMKERSKISTIGSWLRGAAILVVLLGTTWMFGLFLLYESKTMIMQYIFTILNSLQGLFIFVFHCLTNEKVQKEYKRAIQRAAWLPDCVRVRYGDLGISGALSTPTQSTSSSGKTMYQRMFPKNKKKQSLSDSSLLNSDSGSHDNRVRVMFSSPQDGSWPRLASTNSECTSVTDSSEIGFCNPVNKEDAGGHREQIIITNINGSSRSNTTDQC